MMKKFNIMSVRQEEKIRKKNREKKLKTRSKKYTNYNKLRKIREQVLPGFNHVFDLIEDREYTLKDMGLNCSCNQFSDRWCPHYYELKRFPWRFRMAQHSVTYTTENSIIECEESTRNGYESLSKFFMVWSAYEVYTRLFGIKPQTFYYGIRRERIKDICQKIRTLDTDKDGNHKLTEFLVKYCMSANSERLNEFINGEDKWFLFFSKEIRNMYVHGNMSAAPNGIKAKDFSKFLDDLSLFFINEIKAHFKEEIVLKH